MTYTQAIGRKFWFDFDDYFKFKAGSNGVADRYTALGGYNAPAQKWAEARAAGDMSIFTAYCEEKKEDILYLAAEQRSFFDSAFNGDTDNVKRAFQDFAFGILASPGTTERPPNELVHTMNGGLLAQDYHSWHGFIEAALVLEDEPDFWTDLRWINGMGWELQCKARPQEIYPNQNEPLAQQVTDSITIKWIGRDAEEIAVEFDNYGSRPFEWLM